MAIQKPHHPDEGVPRRWQKVRGWFSKPEGPDRCDLSRRRLLTQICALAVISRLPACEPKDSPTTIKTKECHKKITFFGNTIEIADEKKFKEIHDKALQHLLLKFSTPCKVPDAVNGGIRNETKDEYWHRAIEEEFCRVLCTMGRYEKMITNNADSLGLDHDVLTYFGIEAGFDPLKCSPSGYCGLGQIGKDAVRDVRTKTKINEKIADHEMNPWYDLRYDPTYGIPNGVAYLKLIRDEFPKTVQKLLRKFSQQIKRWLEEETDRETHKTRLDDMEEKLQIQNGKKDEYETRYERLTKIIMPREDITIADPESFAIHSYNIGSAGVAKLVILNFFSAHLEKKNLMTDKKISIFHLDPTKYPDKTTQPIETKDNATTDTNTDDDTTILASIDLDAGQQLKTSDTDAAMTERQTYLWQALVFKEIMDQWHTLKPGESMTVTFKDQPFTLKKPDKPTPTYEQELKDTTEIEVPVGLDLIKFAEYLQCDEAPDKNPEEVDHHKVFRLKGNAAFVRGGAYYSDPKKDTHGTVTIRVPKAKVTQAKTYLKSTPAVIAIYEIKKGDTANGILQKIKQKYTTAKENPELKDLIFWEYNRMGRGRIGNLSAGKKLALPAEFAL